MLLVRILVYINARTETGDHHKGRLQKGHIRMQLIVHTVSP
jgi:hypothetical protein